MNEVTQGESNGRVVRRRRRQRFVSAQKVVVVGIICFGVWLFLDARQLYLSASASPIGVRRSVAMSILAPIARVEETLSFDRIVNSANRIVGKSGTPGGSAVGLALPNSDARSQNGIGSRRRPKSPSRSTVTKHPVGLPTLAQPSAAKPLTILDVGDSIGEDLGYGLNDELSHASHLQVILKSVGDTGLANLSYYNWIAELPALIKTYHPNAIVVMLGGNDGQAFQQGNAVLQFGTAAWKSVYNQRVGQMMSEATNVGIHMVWVGLPIMGPSSGLSNTDVELQNFIYAAQATLHPGVTFVSSWKMFENAAGQYSTYLPGPGGGLVQVRDSDETHIDPPGGTDRIGASVVAAMQVAWHIKL